MITLPVLGCDGCGVCCAHTGSPPGLLFDFGSPALLRAGAAGLPRQRRPLSEWGASLPPDLLAEMLAYLDGVAAAPRGTPGRYDLALPCLWYDAQTRRCRHYEYRPGACREFEVGGEGCLRLRAERGI